MGSVNSALQSAKKTLADADKFTSSAVKQAGGTSDAFAPKSAPKSNYSVAREARKSGGGEFMGVRSNEAPEVNTALQAREDAKKALQ